MKELSAEVRATIWGTQNAWSLARSSGFTQRSDNVRVVSTIQGDTRNGFHLVQSPEGFFTADTWHATLAEAFDMARDLFNVQRDDWRGG